MKKYLLLGASSALALTFLRQHEWQADDEIIAQYFRNSNELTELKSQVQAKMECLSADFSDEASTLEFTDRLKNIGFVPTHILHVPAVPIINRRFVETSWEETEKQLNVQCRSLWQILQAIIKDMTKAKFGRIILVLSSCSINVPPKFLVSYVTAKYALMGMGKALAAEYAAKNIQINMISPSMMETKFLNNVYRPIVEQNAKQNPLGRNATPSDMVGVIEYLFSDKNTFITGANIPVTGGETF